jgi:hypothetical protein
MKYASNVSPTGILLMALGAVFSNVGAYFDKPILFFWALIIGLVSFCWDIPPDPKPKGY